MRQLYYSDEKIDGSNTQMAFLIENNKIKDIKVGSRNRFIEADDKNNIAKVYSFVDKVSAYVAERRLDNILSHGDISLEPKNIGLLIKEMNKDINEEYLKENPDTDQALLGQALRRLNKNIALTIKNHIGM